MTAENQHDTPRSRRVGGVARAEIARQALKVVFNNEKDALYYAKDIDFARQFFVSRHTVYKIRSELKVLPRSQRIVARLRRMDLKEFTIKELSEKLQVKYQNLYKILLEHDLEVKPDTRPIEYLKRYQRDRKKSKNRCKKKRTVKK